MKTWVGSAVRILGVLGAGAIGAVCTLYINRTEASVKPPPPQASVADQPKDQGEPGTAKLIHRLKGLEQRVGVLEEEPEEESGNEKDESTAQAQARDEHPDAPPASFYYERHDRNIAAHKTEPVDPNWGPKSTESLRSDAERIAALGQFKVKEVECRDATCRVSVHWDKFGTARTSYEQLLHQPMGLQCERTILVPEKGANEPVDATMLMDCTEWKANGSQLLDVSKNLPTPMPALPIGQN